MAQRVQVSGIGRARLRPVASPVDTFVAPQQGGSGLSQLAESLREVAPSVARYSDFVAQKDAKKDSEAGAQKAREILESGTTYKEAIKKGLIPAHASPWFQLGAREQFGRVAAGRFSTDLQNAVENDPRLQESTDVKDFDKFLGDFRKQWMENNVGENRNLDFERGFGKTADAYTEDARRSFVAAAGNRLVKAVGDNHYQEVFQMLDHELSVGTKEDAIADAINIINDRSIALGMNARVANIASITALGDIALRDGNLDLFNVLKKVKGGSGSLYTTKPAQAVIQEITDKVSVKKQREYNAAAAEKAAKLEESTRVAESSIIDKLLDSSNPSALDITKDLHELNKINPTAAKQLVTFQETMTTAKFQSNQDVVNSTLANIFSQKSGPEYVTERTLVRLLNTHDINQSDFAFLRQQVNSRDDNIRQASDRARALANEKGPYKDDQFEDAMSALRRRFTVDTDFTSEKATRAYRAQAKFIQRWLQWANSPAGQNADPLVKNKWLTEMGEVTANEFLNESDKKTSKELPSADLQGWRDKKMASPKLLKKFEDEWNSNEGLSPYSKSLLNRFGITPDTFTEFLSAQKALYNTK